MSVVETLASLGGMRVDDPYPWHSNNPYGSNISILAVEHHRTHKHNGKQHHRMEREALAVEALAVAVRGTEQAASDIGDDLLAACVAQEIARVAGSRPPPTRTPPKCSHACSIFLPQSPSPADSVRCGLVRVAKTNRFVAPM